MTQAQAPVTAYLSRAFGLIDGVREKTEELRQHVIQHEESAGQEATALGAFVAGFQGTRQLAAEKAALVADLNLAMGELDKARSADPEAEIETKEGAVQGLHLRAAALLLNGLIESLHGSPQAARQHLARSIKVFESAAAHYWMALVYEGEYDAVNALSHYERCLVLEPAGEYSVAALRSADQMRNYKKRFRGSWRLMFILLPLWGAGIFYYLKKRK